MPPTWRQSGTILEANESIVRQDAGGGREVWYRLADDVGVDAEPGDLSTVAAFVESLSGEDRDAIDEILESARITPEDPRYAGIAVSLHLTAILARRIDELSKH
jgi:hypothetical protein